VVAITASHSPLARKADVALIVDHLEDINTHVPMVSRILHLLVIDILAVGVAMRRGADASAVLPGQAAEVLDEAQDPPRARGARRAGLGVRTSGPLAGLTSHSR
jgi:glucokinase